MPGGILRGFILLVRLEPLSLRVDLQLPPLSLYGQRSQLRLALDNLLTNAIKHAPPGSTIEIAASAPDHQCQLSVRDHGRGVSNEDKDSIFEPFVRGTEVEEQGIRGTGVGLSIVKEVALAHGGTVVVEDAEPGARFRLAWPCPRPQHFVADGLRQHTRLQPAA